MTHKEIFQSTPPARGATHGTKAGYCVCNISIHAPREGGDGLDQVGVHINIISIHAPREGGRRGVPQLVLHLV